MSYSDTIVLRLLLSHKSSAQSSFGSLSLIHVLVIPVALIIVTWNAFSYLLK